MSEDEIERIFKEIDKDESGSITKKEAVRACRRFWLKIINMILNKIVKMSEEEISRIFKEIDKDESGSITKKEAVRACRRSDLQSSLTLLMI